MKTKIFAGLILFVLIGLAQAQSPSEPPKEKGNFRQADLAELIKLDPTIKLDIRYAKSNNFLGKPVYKEARAFLQRPAAEALVRINKRLKEKGYGLLVFDGYRIVRELHGSSRSHIYLAVDVETDAVVTLKIPSIDLRDDPTW